MTANPSERRRSRRRHRPEDHRISSARIRPGHDVTVINVSAGGAMVEGHRLRPGTAIELQLQMGLERPENVRGRVHRCAVVRLRSDAVCYRGAIVFDRHLPWFAEEALNG
jgi:hypothetical protein